MTFATPLTPASTSPTQYDAAEDVLYLFSEEGPIARSVEVAPGMTIEYGENGQVLGIEILRASRLLTPRDLALLHAQQAGAI